MALLQFVDSHFGAFIGFAYTCVAVFAINRAVNIVCIAAVANNR
jgi:hypothetical protein